MRGRLRNNKDKIMSFVLTLLIVGVIFFLGPAAAVLVGITSSESDSVYNADDTNATFNAYIDIETNEYVPLQNVTLRIRNSDGVAVETCVFDINGNKITTIACSNITSISVLNYANNTNTTDMYGYGYGYDYSYGYGTRNTTFGDGYGYGYRYGYGYETDYGSELAYTIVWDITGISDGNYTADIEVAAENGGNSYIFMTETPASFMIDRTLPTIEISSPTEGATYTSNSVALTFTAQDNIGANLSCEYALNGASVTNVGYVSNGTASSFTISSLSDGAKTLRVNCTDTAGNENSSVLRNFTISASSSSGTSSSTTSTVASQTIVTFPLVIVGAKATSTIADPSQTGFYYMEFTAKKTITNVRITITKLDGQPSTTGSVPAGETLYQYIEITITNAESKDIENIKLKFRIPKSWVDENGIDVNSIALLRYTTQWDELQTTMVDEDDEYYYFEAETPGFSYFAVTGEKTPSGEETAEPCEDGELKCSGDSLMKCDDAGEWQVFKVCANGCDSEAKECKSKSVTESVTGETGLICTHGERKCVGNDVNVCVDGVEWVVINTCENGCSAGQCLQAGGETAQDNTLIWALLIILALVAAVWFWKQRV